ncbi:MAG: glycoside hydrolase family 18 [Bacteroidales bacterium]
MVILNFCSCIDVENIPIGEADPIRSDEYYENLRAWKSTFKEREIMFGWYGNFSGKPSANMATSLKALPDSVDLISLWGGGTDIEDAVKYIQEVKGTKVTFTIFSHDLPSGLGGDTLNIWSDREVLDNAIRLHAQGLVKSMKERGLDGIDLDNESKANNLYYHPENFGLLLSELSKSVGPESGTGKLLMVDGYINLIPDTCLSMVDYCIVQSYGYYNDEMFQRAYNIIKDNAPPSKLILTENFENYASTGGSAYYTDSEGNSMPSFEGMARWTPKEGRKGGVGLFHIEYDYKNAPGYYYTNNAIRIMNSKTYDGNEN